MRGLVIGLLGAGLFWLGVITTPLRAANDVLSVQITDEQLAVIEAKCRWGCQSATCGTVVGEPRKHCTRRPCSACTNGKRRCKTVTITCE
jgi:hypothetical protein